MTSRYSGHQLLPFHWMHTRIATWCYDSLPPKLSVHISRVLKRHSSFMQKLQHIRLSIISDQIHIFTYNRIILK